MSIKNLFSQGRNSFYFRKNLRFLKCRVLLFQIYLCSYLTQVLFHALSEFKYLLWLLFFLDNNSTSQSLQTKLYLNLLPLLAVLSVSFFACFQHFFFLTLFQLFLAVICITYLHVLIFIFILFIPIDEKWNQSVSN